MADPSVFSTAGRTPSAQMDADLSTLHAPEAAAEVVDEGCRRVRERGQIDIVRSATCVDTDDKLCVPKTKSERIDDEARPRWRAKLWRRIAEPDERPAHPFAKTDAF